jgi:hypothetical protein
MNNKLNLITIIFSFLSIQIELCDLLKEKTNNLFLHDEKFKNILQLALNNITLNNKITIVKTNDDR